MLIFNSQYYMLKSSMQYIKIQHNKLLKAQSALLSFTMNELEIDVPLY